MSLAASAATAAIPPIERDALIAFYTATNGGGWKNNTGWNGPSGTECTWFGVTCDSSPRVLALSHDGNGLSGTIPPQIKDLTALQTLNLPRNQLNGSIPAELGSLSDLRQLVLQSNKLTGTIPSELGSARQLENLNLGFNPLTGSIPVSLGNLTVLRALDLSFTQLTGAVPLELLRDSKVELLNLSLTSGLDASALFARIAELPNVTALFLRATKLNGRLDASRFTELKRLSSLDLGANDLTGTIPSSIGQLTGLTFLLLDTNQLTGELPAEIGSLPNLVNLSVAFNRLSGSLPSLARLTRLQTLGLANNAFSGTFPIELTGLTSLQTILLQYNRFTGAIPPQIGQLRNLVALTLNNNSFTGALPREIGNLTKLQFFRVSSNMLTSSIPSEIGQLTDLSNLELSFNAFRGEIPREITNLTKIQRNGYLFGNALYTTDTSVKAFLDQKFVTGWELTQTLPPSNVVVASVSPFSASLRWTPARYVGDPGGYQASVSTTAGGPYAPLVTTPTKYQGGVIVTGLQPQTRYFAIIKTITFAHGPQPNTIFSDPTPEFTFTTTEATTAPPRVIVNALPAAIAQTPGLGGGTTTYRVTNIGGAMATVTLSQRGDFFSQAPGSFTLVGGESQVVTLTGVASAEGAFDGTSIVDGGIAGKLSIPVRLLSASAPAGSVSLSVSSRRVDVTSSSTATTSGGFDVTNNGTATFVGVLVADVEWIIPAPGLIRIAPGATQTVTFTVDPALRPDPSLLTGTVSGTVSLVTLATSFGKNTLDTTGSNAATVTVSLTTAVAPAPSPIPALAPDDVALIIPGVGRIQGSVGLFLSDVSIFNSLGTQPASDLKMYFKSPAVSAPLAAALGSIPTAQSIVFGDVVKNVFNLNSQVGSLQIRTKDWTHLSLSANVLNVSNPAGTYGTSIPVLRSDRGATSADPIFLTGLRKSITSHTNLFLQEMIGSSGTVKSEFFDPNGTIVTTRNDSIGPFELKQINDVVPEGVVMARITISGSARLHTYATPVDRASGDNWSLVDWTRQYAYDPSEPVIIGVAGAASGANDTYFRTDAAITNIECVSEKQRTDRVCGTTDVSLLYHMTSGGEIEKTITIEPFHTALLDDIVSTLFNAVGTIGYVVVKPARGNLLVASRTYTTVKGTAATFGSATPTLAVSSALRSGQFRRLGAIDDANAATIAAKTPATYRNNMVLLEVSGQPATVRVTLSYLDSRGTVTANVTAFKDLDLAAGQMKLMPLVSTVLGPIREELGHLRNLRVQFDVITPTGGVLLFISAVDNGTGDSILRAE